MQFLTPKDNRFARNQSLNNASVFFTSTDIEQPVRFEKIVREFPNRVAVKAGDRVTTHAELNVMANRVAHAKLLKRSVEAAIPCRRKCP